MKHENPFLSSIGTRNDGRRRAVDDECGVSRARPSGCPGRPSEQHNFLGNGIAYPPRGRTGDNCLLATKVMVPISGTVRENVGLLGSPRLRDPAVGRARQQLRPPEAGGRSSAAASPPRTGTTSSPSCGACSRGGCSSSCSPCSRASPGTSTPHWVRRRSCWNSCSSRCVGIAYWILVDRIVTRLQARARAVLLDLRARDVAPRTVLEGALDRGISRSSPAPRSST